MGSSADRRSSKAQKRAGKGVEVTKYATRAPSRVGPGEQRHLSRRDKRARYPVIP
jgi:hypothetical protein